MSPIVEKHNESLSVEIVKQIADVKGVDPVELPPLFDTIDLTLVESLPELATLSFPYQGYTVVVKGDGAVTVRESTNEGEKNHA